MRDAFPVYVVDDDPGIRDWTELVCADMDWACRSFASGDAFLAEVDALAPGCVLLDMRMPRRSGLQVQEELARRGLTLPVIAMTGHGDVEVAVRSMKLGAVDFLEKPFPPDVLRDAIARGFERLREAG